MALENDDLPKAPDKAAEKQQCSTASGVTKVGDDKPPKPMKEKTSLEELDEIELETLLKETLTYKSPRDRDCRSSLFNKLLVSAEDSIRKDSALNASGSEAVRHRNPQASRRSRYQTHRAVGGSGAGGIGGPHQGGHGVGGNGKHGGGGAGGGGPGRREGKGCGGSDGGGSIAEKGTLGGSLNNLTVEDLYESISQHLQQRPEKSVSARQRTGGSLPCNVNAGLITPCETPLFITERQSSSAAQHNSCSTTITTTTTTSPSTTSSCPTTVTTSIATYPITATSTYCPTTSSNFEFGNIVSSTDAALSCSRSMSTTLSTSGTSNSSNSSGITTSASSDKDSCVIEVEQDDCGVAENQMSSKEMVGVQSTATNQTKPPTSNPSQPIAYNSDPVSLTQPSQQTSTNASNISADTNSTTIFIVTNANTLLDGSAACNIPHIDDDDIVEEQQRQYQHKLNYNTQKHDKVVNPPKDEEGTELQAIERRTNAPIDSSVTSSAGASSISGVGYYNLGNTKDEGGKDGSSDEIERRPLLSVDGRVGGWPATTTTGRATGAGTGPMKIIGQGPQIKPSSQNSLHKQLITSSLQTRPSQTTTTHSLEDPPISISNPFTSASSHTAPPPIQHQQHQLPSLSHHHSAQQPHHQHTGAVRISSLSSANMLTNINHQKMRLQQQQQQQRDSSEMGGGVDDGEGGEMAIGVPSSLTGMVGIDRGDGGGRLTVGSYMSEATIHVGDIVDSALTQRSVDQNSLSSQEYNKNFGIVPPTKKIDDNGNHMTKPRKKTKPPEVVHAYQIAGHIGDMAASGDINKVVAFICGNGDISSNVAKTKAVNKSSTTKFQQHRGSVSGTNNRTGGKSVDAEHHNTHSRRHQNHQHTPHTQPPNQQSNNNNNNNLHRANSLEEMPTTTLEEFHENESKHKHFNNNNNKANSATKQVNNHKHPVQTICESNNRKSDNASVHINSVAGASVAPEPSAPTSVVSATSNRGRGVLRATKSNAEKSGGSRSGGSANRGSVTRGGGSNIASDGAGAVLQPRRSWTNADPSPLQAIVTTASAENLETDFTLVNSKKKKGKKQQQRRNSVGSRTPLNTQQQTLTSPPSNNSNSSNNSQQQRNIYNNNNRHNNNNNNNSASSNTTEYHSSNANANNNTGATVVNLASLVQASAGGNTGTASVAHSDRSNGDCSSLDEDSVHSQMMDGGCNNQSNQNQQQQISSPPNLTSYASITKNNVATQQPIIMQQTVSNNTVPTPKWPSTSPATTTIQSATTTVTAITTGASDTASATVVCPENNVIVPVPAKVVTNRSQEQQTDDIPPTLLLDASGSCAVGDGTIALQGTIVNVAQPLEQQVQRPRDQQPIATEIETNRHQPLVSSDPPSLGDMQRWPSINNNKTPDQSEYSHDDINTNATYTNATSGAVSTDSTATWPSLSKPAANCAIPVVSAAADNVRDDVKTGDHQHHHHHHHTTARVVVRTSHVGSTATAYVKPLSAPPQHQQGEQRVVLKDGATAAVNDHLQNQVNSARHGGNGNKQQYQHNSGTGMVLQQNHVVVQPMTVVHPVMITQHPPHCIPLIPITTLPPPNLIDHNTPPPPNFIPNHIHQQQYQHRPQYTQPLPEQSNCVVYSNIQQLPVNIPDVQMIEHQLQQQHNNNNNVHSKNSYNQQYNETKTYRQPTVDFVQLSQPQIKRPAVVIMRGNSSDTNQLNSSLTGDLNANEDDGCCSELTFGFDVNEELLSLQVDETTVINANMQNIATCTGGDIVDVTTVLPDVGCIQSSKDVCKTFANRFVIPDCCSLDKEFNYEKIVDFVANAWNETLNTGKCNFYEDL